MRITDLSVDGFGLWHDLELSELGDKLTVLYGPNEAGKTTLLEFVRSVLYGFSDHRRHRYLPPLRGGRPGGRLKIVDGDGRYTIDRHDDGEDASPEGRLTIVSDVDGVRRRPQVLAALLSGVDESTFNNVFAVSLRELQELATLNDSQAADSLYSLTAGLDRVPLIEVLQELDTGRRRLLETDGRKGQIADLLAERESIVAELEKLATLSDRYTRLLREREQIDRELAGQTGEIERLEHDVRMVEIASQIREQWRERETLASRLGTADDVSRVAADALDRFEALTRRIKKHHARAKEIKTLHRSICDEAQALPLDKSLWRQSARVEALCDQSEWIVELESHIAALEGEINQLDVQLRSDRERFGLTMENPATLAAALSRDVLSSLRGPARALRDPRGRMREALRQAEAARQQAESLENQIRAAMSGRPEAELSGALETVGGRVSSLRRRVQLDERFDQMARHEEELKEQHQQLLTRQLMPAWVLISLGAVFVGGVVLILAGLFLPTSIAGTIGGWLAALGFGGAISAGITKVLLDRSAARQLDVCEKQIEMLALQRKQSREEREQLDQQLAAEGAGPLIVRLQAAERELAELEAIVPLDAERQVALREVERARQAAADARREAADARHRWRQALERSGLPGSLSPRQVRELAGHADRIGESVGRLEQRKTDLASRKRSLENLVVKVNTLLGKLGQADEGQSATEALARLKEQWNEQRRFIARRDTLRNQSRRLKREYRKRRRAVAHYRRRQQELLRSVQVEDAEAFRSRAAHWHECQQLRDRWTTLDREIAAAIGGHCTQEAMGDLLVENDAKELDRRWGDLTTRLLECEERRRAGYEERGEMTGRLKSIAEDRRPAEKRLELGLVESRLSAAADRWRVLAVTHKVLESIRKHYEQHRQPEALKQASSYLHRLTKGRYSRVWTPLGEQVLYIDDAKGRPLPVEVLSRGTREQLFLSLRLALAESYARRGANLPLVLDDLLVNFDVDRAKAAARVLRDFANEGHQVLVFTCHEHITKIFKSLKTPIHQLPAADEDEIATVVYRQTAAADRRAPAAARVVERRPGSRSGASSDGVESQEVVTARWNDIADDLDAQMIVVQEDDIDDGEDTNVLTTGQGNERDPNGGDIPDGYSGIFIEADQSTPVEVAASENDDLDHRPAGPRIVETPWSDDGAEEFQGEFAERGLYTPRTADDFTADDNDSADMQVLDEEYDELEDDEDEELEDAANDQELEPAVSGESEDETYADEEAGAEDSDDWDDDEDDLNEEVYDEEDDEEYDDEADDDEADDEEADDEEADDEDVHDDDEEDGYDEDDEVGYDDEDDGYDEDDWDVDDEEEDDDQEEDDAQAA